MAERRRITPASPFDQLLGLPMARMPSAPTTLVVEGQRVSGRLKLADSPPEDADEQDAMALRLRKLRKEQERVTKRNGYLRRREDPEVQARQAAYREAHAEQAKEYFKRYMKRPGVRDRCRKLANAAALRRYHADPEKARAANREKYLRSKERSAAKNQATPTDNINQEPPHEA